MVKIKYGIGVKMKIYVVTCPELGWDCVVGIYDEENVDLDDLKAEFPEGQYVIEDRTVQYSLN